MHALFSSIAYNLKLKLKNGRTYFKYLDYQKLIKKLKDIGL